LISSFFFLDIHELHLRNPDPSYCPTQCQYLWNLFPTTEKCLSIGNFFFTLSLTQPPATFFFSFGFVTLKVVFFPISLLTSSRKEKRFSSKSVNIISSLICGFLVEYSNLHFSKSLNVLVLISSLYHWKKIREFYFYVWVVYTVDKPIVKFMCAVFCTDGFCKF
jgi:hypothetical protein